MNAKILVVDDSHDAIALMTEWLDRFEYQVITASRGEQALALAQSEAPDVILLDVVMPGMDGIEVCRRLRADPDTSNIPVILITARSPTEGRAEGLMAGAVDYITKPVNMRDLVLRIEAALNQLAKGRVENTRLLDEMVNVALAMLPCDLAWLLVLDIQSGTLVHRAIAAEKGNETAIRFLQTLSGDDGAIALPMVPGVSPLTQVLITRQSLLNQPVDELRAIAGGERLYQACKEAKLAFCHIAPLFSRGRAVGTLVMGSRERHDAFSSRGRQAIAVLSNQAAIAIENARLLTDLMQREEQTRSERAYRQMILDTMGDGLVVIDDNGIIQFVNVRLLRMTGYSRKQLIGQHVGMIFHPEGRERLVAGLLRHVKATMAFDQRLLTQKGKVVPVLMSRSTTHNPVRPGGRDTIIVLTDLTEQKEREAALERQTKRLRALNRAVQAITASLSEREVINVILSAAADVVRADVVMILRYDEHSQSLTVAAAVGSDEARTLEGMRVPMRGSVAGWVASQRTAVLVPDASHDQRFHYPIAEALGVSVQALAAVPLVAQGRLIGVLEVLNTNSRQAESFDSEDVEQLESLAAEAAIAIINAQLFEQTQRRVLELSTLLDASSAASSTLDIGSVLELIAERLLKALHAERCTILSWLNDTRELSTLAEVIDAQWTLETAPVCPLDGVPLVRAVLRASAPVFANFRDAHDPLGVRTVMTAMGVEAMLAAPISIDSHAQGVIALYSTTPEKEFTEADTLLLVHAVQGWVETLKDNASWHAPHHLEMLRHHAMSALGARWCVVFHVDPETSDVRMLREQGFALWLEKPGQVFKSSDYPFEMRALTSKRALAFPMQSHDEGADDQTLMNMCDVACLVAPLNIRGESRGLVKLTDSDPTRRFDPEELLLCQGIANLMGNALENAELYRSLERRAHALEIAYSELQEVDRIKDELTQNVSHELRTPLAFISGYLDLLANEDFGPLNEDQKESMEVVIRKAHDLSHLVDDMMSIQRIGANNLNRERVSLPQLVQSAMKAATITALKGGLKLVRDFPDKMPPAYVDPQRINEVLDNLLGNAIKFSPSGGEIRVSMREQNETHLVVGVHDQGIGIAPEHLDKIWSRFYQVDGSTTRRFGGTGLGLAIVRRIVESHGGRVWVESQPGKGSAFYFTVPKYHDQPVAPPKER